MHKHIHINTLQEPHSTIGQNLCLDKPLYCRREATTSLQICYCSYQTAAIRVLVLDFFFPKCDSTFLIHFKKKKTLFSEHRTV